jgi:hypothetical protein
MVAPNRLTLLLNDSFEHRNIMAYTSSTDLLIEQRQLHPKHAITQIHPVLSSGDQQTLENCLQASHEHSQPVSPGSNFDIDYSHVQGSASNKHRCPIWTVYM